MTYALELQDRALALARDGVVLSVAPGAQATHGESVGFGAGDLRARLNAAQVEDGRPFWCVTSAAVDPAALGTVLALTRRAGAAVGAFIDGAAISAAALDLRRDALIIEIGLHHVGVTSVAAGQVVRKRRAVVSRQSGWFALCDAWLALLRSIMVNRTRLDPLRELSAERRLFDSLPALARTAAVHGSALARIEAGGHVTEISVSADQLAAAAEGLTRELARLAAQLRGAGTVVDVIAPLEIGVLPGIDRVLASLAGGDGERQFLLPDGFAAAAASLLDPPESSRAEVVPFVQRARASAHDVLRALVVRPDAASSLRGAHPSHILYQGRAFALGEAPVVVGRATSGNTIVLPESAAGISRRHCTVLASANEVVLVDHSRFGTLVNGERILERARIHTGDRILIGEPGVELDLIAVESALESQVDAPPTG